MLGGHLLAFAFPASILVWNREPLRLFVLEGVGLIAAGTALLGLIATFARRLRDFNRRGTPSPLHVIVGTLVAVEVVTGIAHAVLYRWASSWSGVTLTPYLLSLVRLEPSVTLVARMPFLVRLHVFCAFAVVAVAPCSRLAGSVVVSIERCTRWAVARMAPRCAPAGSALDMGRTKYARSLQAVLLRNDDREN